VPRSDDVISRGQKSARNQFNDVSRSAPEDDLLHRNTQTLRQLAAEVKAVSDRVAMSLRKMLTHSLQPNWRWPQRIFIRSHFYGPNATFPRQLVNWLSRNIGANALNIWRKELVDGHGLVRQILETRGLVGREMAIFPRLKGRVSYEANLGAPKFHNR